jgi:uncharacterized repeat protein (TIGR01451 family)
MSQPSRYPVAALLLVCAVTLTSLTAFKPYATPEQPTPPANVTARAWQATNADATVDLIVTAPGFPDLSPARALPTKEAKTKFVVDALTAHATTAQAQLRADLATLEKTFASLWITNQIVVRAATRADVQWLAARTDVQRVDVDVQSKGVEDVKRGAWAGEGVFSPPSTLYTPLSVEWGVLRVNAPQVWAMGHTGQGIVVANLDTGVRWDHAALKPKYRGWNGSTADHNYNWFDAAPNGSDPASPIPVDVNGHGTHTVGTSNGDDGLGNQIGVAPGAQWIACRNMAGPSGIGSVARYTSCFQFALAPTDVNGNNPDPDKSADITSNSWGCDPSFGEIGCDVPTALVTVTQVLRDAGVMVVASAGNDGNACRTVINAPATLDQSFSIGATDSGNGIAGFSSRGPSSLTGKTKPDVVAPGVGVRSATFESTNSYGFKSGTSMAAPHVAGIVALLWSAAPWLRGDVPATEAILRETATPMTNAITCFGTPGTAIPNNTFGHGLINAQAAVTTALAIVPKTTSPALADMSTPVSFTIATTNARSITLNNVVISTTLPTSATLISSSPVGTVNGNVITWEFTTLAPSSALSVTFVIHSATVAALSNTNTQISYAGLATPILGTNATTLLQASQRTFAPFVAR